MYSETDTCEIDIVVESLLLKEKSVGNREYRLKIKIKKYI